MSKSASQDIRNGRFVIGRRSGEAFSAIEGQVLNSRTGRIIRESEDREETPEQLRARIRAEFSRK